MKKSSLILGLLLLTFLMVSCAEDKPTVRLETPTNLSFSADTLTFNPVEYATSYLVFGEGINDTTPTNTYTFKTEGVFKVRVVAKANGYLDSLFSIEIEVIVIFADSKPYMTSDKNITSNLVDDTILTFQSLDYTFDELSGSGIQSSDYIYDNDVLTIKASFIKKVFEDNPGENNIVLIYSFVKDNLNHIGFITIQK